MIDEILKERGNNYGSFHDNALVSQTFKRVIRLGANYHNLSYCQKEALDMILHKISRIINGNETYLDSWVDIVGYSQLVIDEMTDPT
ncbi:DUF6378 domain-containing protein [Moraxella atlantae]|uniref:DUF6378 domain-containing protein n=1 Tax=Faucicola atlantae TaxID=34059 RepID=UPI003750C529